MKNLESNASKKPCKMLPSYCTLPSILLLEYFSRDFSEVILQVPFPREFILELLNTYKA